MRAHTRTHTYIPLYVAVVFTAVAIVGVPPFVCRGPLFSRHATPRRSRRVSMVGPWSWPPRSRPPTHTPPTHNTLAGHRGNELRLPQVGAADGGPRGDPERMRAERGRHQLPGADAKLQRLRGRGRGWCQGGEPRGCNPTRILPWITMYKRVYSTADGVNIMIRRTG